MKNLKLINRKKRSRAKIKRNLIYPKICVSRSNKYIYCQIVDLKKGKTIISASSKDKEVVEKKGTGLEKAFLVGEILAKRALNQKIKKVVFDKSGYKYHGKVKALADGARKGGLIF